MWPVKSRQMSIKVAQKHFASKKKDFDKFTKIALGKNNYCLGLWKVTQSEINRTIWSHCNLVTLLCTSSNVHNVILYTLSLSPSPTRAQFILKVFQIALSHSFSTFSLSIRLSLCDYCILISKPFVPYKCPLSLSLSLSALSTSPSNSPSLLTPQSLTN